jgi:hypothetical protein
MTVFRMALSTWLDSTLPTDALIITPHFDDHGISTDPDNLASDLITAWTAWMTPTAQGAQVECKVYDAEAPAPNFPVATKRVRNGVSPASPTNRDVAVCLSFFADVNRPRHRGRLYIPVPLTGVAPSAALVPSTLRTKVGDLVPIFAGLGGLDVDWVVWSRVDRVARKVSDWWVDDSWDTQRRRGRRATARTTGTTSG